MNTTMTKLEDQFNTADQCIVAEESGNDYMIDNHFEMFSNELIAYDYRTQQHDPGTTTRVNWKIKKFIAESMTGVSAQVIGVDSRGRHWTGSAQFKIIERVEAYDDLNDEDFYMVHLEFNKHTYATGCDQDHQDQRIDSAMGLLK